MLKTEILEGITMKSRIDTPSSEEAFVSFIGDVDTIPISESVLSKHVLYTGTTGTGKTTAIFQLLRQLIHKMDDNDVMVVFDTKGDFRKEFYRPDKDVVISSDEKATAYWNIFKEAMINGEDHTEENLLEIVNSLFEDKIKRSNAPLLGRGLKYPLSGIP